MSAIDVHTHAFPDDVAARAIPRLEASASWKAIGDGTIKGLLKSMDAADVDVSVICTIATKPDQTEGILKWCRKIRTERIEPFPSVHPADAKAAQWVRQFANEGFSGIKLHPMYQDFPADDARLDGIYAAAAETGLLVALHCGKDIAYPAEDDRAAPLRLRRVADRHPGIKLVCTHLGGWNDWDEVERHLVGTGVLLETSFSVKMLGAQRATEIIRKHGVEKVLFGSDWPWNRQDDEAQLLKGLGLEARELSAILSSNAAKLLGY